MAYQGQVPPEYIARAEFKVRAAAAAAAASSQHRPHPAKHAAFRALWETGFCLPLTLAASQLTSLRADGIWRMPLLPVPPPPHTHLQLAVYAELRQDWPTAVLHYTRAYHELEVIVSHARHACGQAMSCASEWARGMPWARCRA